MNSNTTDRQNSTSSRDSSTLKSVWNRLSHLFSSEESNSRRLSTSSFSSVSDSSSSSGRNNRHRKILQYNDDSHFIIPPYSPTYCKANEFPYSNFYVKLPNGKWMVRYRSGNRDILGTDEFEGYMI